MKSALAASESACPATTRPTSKRRDAARWRSIDPAIERALTRVLRGWCGTPYMAGQCVRGAAADCVQLVAGVLDELHGVKPRPVWRASHHAIVHGSRQSLAVIREMRSRYPAELVSGRTIEPGDIVVVPAELSRRKRGRPGHVLIAGVQPGSALHAVRPRVAWTSIGAFDRVVRVYRPTDKEQWL